MILGDGFLLKTSVLDAFPGICNSMRGHLAMIGVDAAVSVSASFSISQTISCNQVVPERIKRNKLLSFKYHHDDSKQNVGLKAERSKEE